MIVKDDPSIDHKAQAIFQICLLLTLRKKGDGFGITNELPIALQRKSQDIVYAMTLVKMSKQRLQVMRDDG